MTDPRLGAQLLAAIRKLPAGSGVVFRHYSCADVERRKLFACVRRICSQRGHVLLLAGDTNIARRWKADGYHGSGSGAVSGLCSAPVHDPREIARAKRQGADIMFLSPVRATHSHPGARPLGVTRFKQLSSLCRPAKVIALGGMNRAEAAKWPRKIIHGWAGIDAFAG